MFKGDFARVGMEQLPGLKNTSVLSQDFDGLADDFHPGDSGHMPFFV